MKGAIFQAVGEAMKSIRLDLEEKIKNIPDEDLVVFPPGKMKKVARVFVEWDKKISEESLHNADLFFEIKTKLSSCKDEEKESLVLLNFSQILKDHNEAFYEKFVKREVVEDGTLDQFYGTGLLKHVIRSTQLTGKYEKDIAAVLAEIKMKQMQKETEMKELASKIEDLTDMWQKRVRKYKKEINELRAERKKTERCYCLQHNANESLTEKGPTIYYHLAGKKFLVRNTFKRTNKEQISIKKGDKIKIVMPADYRGFALVEKKGWFGLKKRGLFPVSHLTIDALD